MLKDVSMGGYSKWNLVYLPREGRVFWRTRENDAIRFVDLKNLAADCGKPARLLDIDDGPAGDASARFEDYRASTNLRQVKKALHMLPLPPGTAEKLAAFPDTFSCRAP